jgi:hypothetical protein
LCSVSPLTSHAREATAEEARDDERESFCEQRDDDRDNDVEDGIPRRLHFFRIAGRREISERRDQGEDDGKNDNQPKNPVDDVAHRLGTQELIDVRYRRGRRDRRLGDLGDLSHASYYN